jgi:pSer/pThr/pTyr-binding forkhead associated (FHA) protein
MVLVVACAAFFVAACAAVVFAALRRRDRRAALAREAALGAHLVVVAGPARGASYPLASGTVTLGSAAGNDLVVPDPAISRRHLELIRTRDGWLLVDAGATNGVWVNGRRVARVVLVPGDRLRVGETDALFVAGADAGPGLAEIL